MAVKNYRKLVMVAGSFYIPKKNPSKPKGEDAHFFSSRAQVIGVADGVGGWAKDGIDAGEYARQLMRNAASVVRSCPVVVDPKRVLRHAYNKTDAKGTSTACIITLAGNILRAANLGDSGFLVIRDGKTVFKSREQQDGFNCPYQMGKHSSPECSPDKAEEMEFQVEAGDVVIAATDGLFDNLFKNEIERMVGLFLQKMGLQPEVVAQILAKAAHKKALKATSGPTPFELAAREAGFQHTGGKYDDITVVVAHVVEND